MQPIILTGKEPRLPLSGEEFYDGLMAPINPALTTEGAKTPLPAGTPEENATVNGKLTADFAAYDARYTARMDELSQGVKQYEHGLLEETERRDARREEGALQQLEDALNSPDA